MATMLLFAELNISQVPMWLRLIFVPEQLLLLLVSPRLESPKLAMCSTLIVDMTTLLVASAV
jgi:hypothetical protein